MRVTFPSYFSVVQSSNGSSIKSKSTTFPIDAEPINKFLTVICVTITTDSTT